MRQIGTIEDEAAARRFGDYLLAQKIPNSVEESRDGWAVWVEHDDQLDRARGEIEAYRGNPSDPRYDAAREANRIRGEQRKKQERLRKRFVDVRTRWAQPQRLARPVTIGLIVVSILIGIGTGLGGRMGPFGYALQIAQLPDERREAIEARDAAGTLTQRDVSEYFRRQPLAQVMGGQVWRLVTPIFLHFGAIHLIFNMFWLFSLGGLIESRKGPLFLLGFVLAAAVISNLGQYAWEDHRFGGMSGVNYALFGYLWMKTRFDAQSGMAIGSETVVVMLAWLVISGILVPNVAHAAHLVGLIVGVVAGYAPVAWRKLRRRM